MGRVTSDRAEMRTRASRFVDSMMESAGGLPTDEPAHTLAVRALEFAGDVLALTEQVADRLAETEQDWSDLATAHRKRDEWDAATRAADVADHLRFYRLHREALDSGVGLKGRAV